MAEAEFERRLERLFADPPDFPDSEGFAQRVERRLNRGWATRRALIGVAGVAGGVVGASQLIMTNFAGALQSAAAGVTSSVNEVAPAADWIASLTGAGEVVWLAAGLAGLAIAFAITRMIEEI